MRRALLAMAVIAGAASLAGQVPATPPPARTPPVAATPVVIGYTDGAFTAPATLPSGYTWFRASNRGKALHHATLLRLENGHTLAELKAALAKGPPPWITVMGGLQNSGDVGIELTPGSYAWLCTLAAPGGGMFFQQGMIHGFTVTRAASEAKPPAADIVMTMRDYTWSVTTPLTAGRHVIKVVNAPGQPHEFMLVRLMPGKSTNDFTAWAGTREGPRVHLSIEGIPTLPTGGVNYVLVDLKPGRYSVVSFNPDARDGRNQFAHGMVRELVIR